MLLQMRLPLFLSSLLFLATPAIAETPNLQPGLWSHTSTTTVEGAMAMPAQTNTNQECLTQEDLNKGIDMLELPQDCAVINADIGRDRMEYSLNCNMQGMTATFNGHADFLGDRMQGNMQSDMDTPLGKMQMKMDYQAKRIGDCQ